MSTVTDTVVPAFIRGVTVSDDLVPFGGRVGDAAFRAPDPSLLIDRLVLGRADALADIQDTPLDVIVTFLARVGQRLRLTENALLSEALEHSARFSGLTPPLLRASYEQLPAVFTEDAVREVAERTIGAAYLEGWVPQRMTDGRVASIRAFGARAVHIVAGNSPMISALSIVRNAVTRSDALIKAPSNDPLTALAIARTMAEVDPDHPVTRHLAVAYWKGGNEPIERALYQPRNVEKIIAWGGLASVAHVLRYVQPGLELIPGHVSTKPRRFDPELRAQLTAARTSPDFYRVFGGDDDEGAVIVSQFDEPVDFHRILSGRVANVVPVADIADVMARIDASTQTIGIYPESLKAALRDRLAVCGAQRLVTLGYAASANFALPQDAIEPVRRMVRWVVDERCDPDEVPPLWR